MRACIIPRPGQQISLEDLVQFLTNEDIAKVKLPKRVELMQEFPLSPIGKVSKKDLVALVSSRTPPPA